MEVTILLLTSLFSIVAADLRDDYASGSVYLKDGKPSFVPGALDKNAAAYGFYNNTLHSTGWGVLEIRAGYGALIKNRDVAFAAGYLEGVLTAPQIWNHYQNMRPVFLPTNVKKSQREDKVRAFFKLQDTWTRQMIEANPGDKYWRHVSYIVSQLDGLYAGYKSVAQEHSDWEQDEFVPRLLNAVGDLLDLIKVVDPSSVPDYDHMSKDALLNLIKLQGHCSALVKVLGAYEDVFMSHSSWFVYAATNRIYKHYHFNIDDNMASKDTSFSSYPGFLESLDDFYLLSSRMVLLQTTNNVFNTSLYKNVTHESLFAWQRVRLANAMANTAPQWADIFAQYNSGTYNNQYMVIDLKRIQLRNAILDDALWVVEQIPSLVVAADQSDILRTGYWPSYNVPFYERVYNLSGYPDFVQKHGNEFSYQLAPRAKIFRRDQASVKDMPSMQHIMRYNDYQHDPYSGHNACSTICCRGDLNKQDAKADGCYDTKVTDYTMAARMQAMVINGPTLGDDLPPFSWSDPQFQNISHIGLPDTYKFGWVLMQPIL